MAPDLTSSPSALEGSVRVRIVVGRLRRRILKAAEDDDLTLGQASALARLSDHPGDGGCTAADLAAAEGVRHQSMTATLGHLASSGLVERAPDPNDGRRQLVSLTAAGRRRVQEGRHARTEWLAAQLEERCTEEERRTVLAAMTVLERLTHD